MWILILLAVLVVILLLFKLFKVPKAPCILFVSGEVKGGKTMLTLWLAKRKYIFVHNMWHVRCWIARLLGRDEPEEPIFCSNIPVAGIPYVPLTKEILRREHRLPYKSVTFISESHLVIDSMTIRNVILNEQATLFYKLYGHATRGGYCFVESQTIADNHFSLKRSVSRYYQIFDNVKIKPFFALLRVHELAYSEDNSVVNVNNMDYESKFSWIFIPWGIVKCYDCYCYSASTDFKPIAKAQIYKKVVPHRLKRLKVSSPVSFRTFHSLSKGDCLNEE